MDGLLIKQGIRMKITIEYLDKDDKPQTEVLDGITDCAIVGCGRHKELTHFEITKTVCPKNKDSYYYLIGKCHEMAERLRRKIDSLTQ